MPARYPPHLAKLALGVLALLLTCVLTSARAEEAVPAPREYQLEVMINGHPVGLVARFVDTGDGQFHFSSPASELRELGLRVPGATPDDALIPLDSIAGLSYVYDEPKQEIALQVGDESREPKIYDLRGSIDHPTARPSDFGAVLNYSLYGSITDETSLDPKTTGINGVNASLDARLLSPLGVFTQTGVLGTTLAGETSTLRLESTYTFADDGNLMMWRAGDVIQGGLGWTRPVRLGGAQVQRSFSLRPDIVTSALPGVSGSAAVPSTIDVFINGVKSHSQQVGAGPFQISNLPAITGAGVAQVVTTDAAGRQTVQNLSFYSSPQLLRPGLYDFSLEAGLPRQAYGSESNKYDSSIAASATVRAGIFDWLTGETHTEASGGLYNAGLGLVASVFDSAIVSGAATASTSDEGRGYQIYGSLQTSIGPVNINARSQRAFDVYQDLAGTAARNDTSRFAAAVSLVSGLFGGTTSAAPPRAVDSVTLSMPISYDKSSISASYIRYVPDAGTATELVSATYTRPLIYDANLYVTGFTDIKDIKTVGLYLGVNMPLGDNISLNTGLNARHGDAQYYAEATKPIAQDAGSWGWRVGDHEGGIANRNASLAHRTSAARLEAGVYQTGSHITGRAEVEGAVAVLGGDVYTANRIDDSFAVVDTHAPGVKVLRENTVVGETNSDGKILVPSLLSYQKNKIAIDPMDLPLDAEIASTLDYVTPQFRSGQYIEFDVKKARPSAIVILRDAAGKYVSAGSEVRLDGSEESFLVGYDGQAFLKGLTAVNTVRVTTPGQECTAQFPFTPTGEVQPVIGPEVCQ